MSAQIICILRCNGPDCDARFTCGESRATPTRAKARAERWTYGVRKRSDSGPAPTVDLCPTCSPMTDDLGFTAVAAL
jgi:hypothetical protein